MPILDDQALVMSLLGSEPPIPAVMPVASATAFRNYEGSDCHSAGRVLRPPVVPLHSNLMAG